MTREWSRSMMMSCTVTGVEQERKSQMDSLRVLHHGRDVHPVWVKSFYQGTG